VGLGWKARSLTYAWFGLAVCVAADGNADGGQVGPQAVMRGHLGNGVELSADVDWGVEVGQID
jgi:hypothetical protein